MVRLLAVFVCAGLLPACSISSYNNYKIGVPYRAQTAAGYCGPASILMWRLADGLPAVSQTTIAGYIHATCPSGTGVEEIARGVRAYTVSGVDSYTDYADGIGLPEELQDNFFSRQITSLDRDVPVIAILNGLHAGVVNGGKWSTRADGLKRWDFVYFHDPEEGPDVFYTAGFWMSTNCGGACLQIVSSNAIAGWLPSYEEYGPTVAVRGLQDRPLHPAP